MAETTMKSSTNVHRVHFASCNNHNLKNNLWPIIESRSPDAFVWAGDAIYGDEEVPSADRNWRIPVPTKKTVCGTPDRLRAYYAKQRNVPGYRFAVLDNPNVTVFGTFDDHDYGCDNADKTFPYRYESGLAYMDFIEGDNPDETREESLMRYRAKAGYGVYGVKLFDFDRPQGKYEVPEMEAMIDPDAQASGRSFQSVYSYGEKTVAIFVLDVRTNKDPWKKGLEAYRLDHNGDFLGERQWRWFESAIRQSRASVNIVVSGLQIHGSIFPNSNINESWNKFPKARERLYNAILQANAKTPILVSGDVHMTQFHRRHCVPKDNSNSLKYRPLIEMTTSGMTHTWGTLPSPPLVTTDAKRLSPSWSARFGLFVRSNTIQLLHRIHPWKSLMNSEETTTSGSGALYPNGGGENAKTGLQFSLEKNFGEIEVDFEQRRVVLRSIGEDPDAPPLLMASMAMDELNPNATDAYEHVFGQEHESNWICVDYRSKGNQQSSSIVTASLGTEMKNTANFQGIVLFAALLLCYCQLSKGKKSLA